MVAGSRFAIFGSNSFAGAAFVRRLLVEGVNVIGFNRSDEGSPIFLPYKWGHFSGQYRFVRADINRDFDIIRSNLELFRPTVVVDFAGQGMVAESWQHPEQWYQTNIVGKVRLHEVLRSLRGLEKYVRISTPEVYGSADSLLKENWNFNPTTPYAVSHAAIDMSLRAYHKMYGLPVVYARFANFYGPGQQLYRIIPRTIVCALTSRKLPLQGEGKSVRAFIFGSDVADAILSAASRGQPGQVYHFSPHEFHTIRDVVLMVADALQVDFDNLVEQVPSRPSQDRAYLMDSSRARDELSWMPVTTLRSGIQQTIDWVKRNIDEIRGLSLDYFHKA